MKREIAPVHPGEILLEEFLNELGMTMHELALALRVPANRISQIVEGKRGVSTGACPNFQKKRVTLGGGIRTHEGLRPTGLSDQPLRPLGHTSAGQTLFEKATPWRLLPPASMSLAVNRSI
jgi:hypothetical protein